MFDSVLSTSILGRALKEQDIVVDLINFRDFTDNKHKKVDDYPYGGGAGLVLSVQPIDAAVEYCKQKHESSEPEIIMMTPQGEPFTHAIAQELAQKQQLIFICGHYEGFDERIRENIVTRELSLGDFVLTGGELASMAMIDAIIRLKPNVIQAASHEGDSFANGLLEYPQYTRPQTFKGWEVPEVLLSGHHENISKWRLSQSLERTKTRRPDLYKQYQEEKSKK